MIRALVVLAIAASACTVHVDVLTIDAKSIDTARITDARECFDDSGCTFGAEICTVDLCGACPPTADCFACPTGWTRLQRNGCDECECAPPVTCDATTTSSCPGGECEASMDCASTACLPSDTKCCATQCVATSTALCASQLPVGCQVTCTTALSASGCTRCLAESCTCGTGGWNCTAVCAPTGYAPTC